MTCGRRILVVDDDESLLEAYRDILTHKSRGVSRLEQFTDVADTALAAGSVMEFEVHTATQGDAALALVSRSLERAMPYAAAFIDIRMPPGMDGLETARRIRELDQRIHVIFVTAYSDHSIEEIQDTVRHDVLMARKPLTRDEVLQLAHNAVLRWEEDARAREAMEVLLDRCDRAASDRANLEQLFSSLSEGLMLTTSEGMVLSVNPAMSRLCGMPEEALLGRMLQDMFPAMDVPAALRQAREQGPVKRVETEFNSECAQGQAVLLSISPVSGVAERDKGQLVILVHPYPC
ncbi:MAG: response regulator [Magnetococcus sp. WYHC-3]